MKPFTAAQKYCYDLIQISYLDDTSFTAADLSAKGQKVAGRTLSSLMDRGYIIRINDKSPYAYINAHKEYSIVEETTSNKKKSPKKAKSKSNDKADNQWIGKYFELCCVEQINQTWIIPDPTQYKSTNGYNFTEEEKQRYYEEAKRVADFIGSGHHAKWIGEHTVTGKGDILLDNKEYVEIKHVSAGKSTYHNTSLFYLQSFGIDFDNYLNKYKFRELIQELNPDLNISLTNHSPITSAEAKMIKEERLKIYKQISVVDTQMRKELTTDVVNFFKNNPEQAKVFYTDMVSKYKISRNLACVADRFIVYNYNLDTVEEFDLQRIQNNPATSIKANPLGFWIGDLNIQLGWQNGIGCNPTIRVFLK